MGGGAFPGMDDLDPIAILVLFEEWDPQTESSQDDQAGVCLGLFAAIGLQLQLQLLFTGGPENGQLTWLCLVSQLGHLGRGGVKVR